MNPTRRLLTSSVALFGICAFVGGAIAADKGQGNDKGKGNGKANHKNGKQLLDVVALECDLPVYKISVILFNMEFKGVIRPLPGKLYEAI